MKFSEWLRNSNEAKVFRDAFDAVDNFPLEHGLKQDVFNVVQAKTEAQWRKTKEELDLCE